jgi:predicted nucleic acid-binding protein
MSRRAVYLDANFLVDWLVRKEPVLRKRARSLLARLLTQFDMFVISPLVIDEFWKGIKEEIDVNRTHSYSADFLQRQLESCTTTILNYHKIQVVQFQDPRTGITVALGLLQKFSLKPRDAFHIAIMQDHQIVTLVTRDDELVKKASKLSIEVVVP